MMDGKVMGDSESSKFDPKEHPHGKAVLEVKSHLMTHGGLDRDTGLKAALGLVGAPVEARRSMGGILIGSTTKDVNDAAAQVMGNSSQSYNIMGDGGGTNSSMGSKGQKSGGGGKGGKAPMGE